MFEAKDKVEVVWRSFQLDADVEYIPGQSVHEYLGKRKGTTAAGGKRMNDAMTAMAKEAGLEYNFDIAVISNTLDAHRLLHLAKTRGVQNELKERLFKAYYTEGKNISDPDTLVQLGTEIGLSRDEIKSTLQTGSYKQEVMLDQYEAQQVGVRGVPFFLFNRKYAVSGAQPADLFSQALNRAWKEEMPALSTGEGEGVCTADGVCT